MYSFRPLILLLFIGSFSGLFAQSPGEEESDKIDRLLQEGIVLHDNGDFQGAIAKYDQILELKKDDFSALVEKGISIFMSGDYNGCIDNCEHIIKIHRGQDDLYLVYTTLGNALDNVGKPEEAIDAYKRGIEKFPDHYMLHFNLGVTYLREGKTDKGIASLIADLNANPEHAGGNYALGVALASLDRRGPALLALSRFMLLEAGTDRNILALELIQDILKGNAEKTGRKSMSISLPAPEDEGADDNFTAVDLMVDMLSLADQDRKLKKAKKGMNAVEVMADRLGVLYGLCGEMHENGTLKGPITELYVPFFNNLKEEDYTLTLAYVMHMVTGEKYVEKWVEDNMKSVEELISWSFEQGKKD